jgi:hypothetical protein
MKPPAWKPFEDGLIAAGKPFQQRLLILAEKPLRQKLLMAAAMILGMVALRYLILLPGWMKQRRETRQYIAVNNLTPDRLVARCGPPISDETKDLFPMIARDMVYKSGSSSTVVLKFSKTAEESSEWIFMAMQDPTGRVKYEAPAAQISVLSCLDSRR